MTQLPLTLTVAGRAGPYDLDAELLVYRCQEALVEGCRLDARLPDGSLATIEKLTDVEAIELTPGRWALKAVAHFDDSIVPPQLVADDAA